MNELCQGELLIFTFVGRRGVEPPRVTPYAPKAYAYTNFATDPIFWRVVSTVPPARVRYFILADYFNKFQKIARNIFTLGVFL